MYINISKSHLTSSISYDDDDDDDDDGDDDYVKLLLIRNLSMMITILV